MIELLVPFLEGTIRTATPLAFAALGETVSERSGVINIGLEGSIIAGAMAALLSAGIGGVWIGFAGAAAGGLAIALLFAVFTVLLRADQIITGTAISLFALGLTGTAYRLIYGTTGVALTTPTLAPTPIPLLANIPIIGPVLFNQTVVTYLRAIGENPEAAMAAGISPKRFQLAATAFSGLLGGLAGGVLVLAQAGTFAEGMSAGRGFIAIAIVVLGRWHPIGTAIAALIFGAASALQFFFQAMGWEIPYQLFLAFPYALTLVALAVVRKRTYAPAALGRSSLTGSV